ncbi:MAG: nucleotide exchange factor GrpE [Candidatus Thermofonsia Clade 3 bacterium]|jgi:molecular chaperone GrpE|uniref:Protein GrpE n=1 Tax=Candidatus Thermofonsia Clade 3 bacterium TaxID=2364212 RepID=A0A2M8QE37_9CHLR|nr:nucleotide exchange factor GrpE [Candidatus Roseilinea sp. NK_OTU-006]PJF48075.1 MAG: nucleotide exchange factor GrpE [Candidatus Thermofonsia Clade 3 bacterium]
MMTETTAQDQTTTTDAPTNTTEGITAAEATTPGAEADPIAALHKALKEAQAKADEYLDGWQRARAEFANYKKRQEQQNADLRAFATLDLIRKLLPIQDDFERAAKTLPEGIAHMTWIEGVMLIQRKLKLILESEGVKEIEVRKNDPFDPTLHEAISHDEAEGVESGHIIEELQKGYKIGDRVIRPTLVRVAK